MPYRDGEKYESNRNPYGQNEAQLIDRPSLELWRGVHRAIRADSRLISWDSFGNTQYPKHDANDRQSEPRRELDHRFYGH